MSRSRKTASKSDAADIVQDATYRVTLAHAIRVGRRMVAGRNVRLKGRVLSEVLAANPAAIAAHEPESAA